MAVSKVHNPRNVLWVVAFALIAIVSLNIRNQRIERLAKGEHKKPQPVQTQSMSDSLVTSYAQPGTVPLQAPQRERDLSGAMWKAIFYTALILGTILIAAWAIKRYGSEKLVHTASPDMKIIGRRYLNPKQSIALVKVREKELLLGITDHTITLLVDFTPDDDSLGPEFAKTLEKAKT